MNNGVGTVNLLCCSSCLNEFIFNPMDNSTQLNKISEDQYIFII